MKLSRVVVLVILFLSLSDVFSDKILLVVTYNHTPYKNAIDAAGTTHSITTISPSSFRKSDLDVDKYEQVCLMSWMGESMTGSSMSTDLKSYLASATSRICSIKVEHNTQA